ncbi:MAG TPA: hypothetical protein VI385_05685 [Flavisolibacter sp.]
MFTLLRNCGIALSLVSLLSCHSSRRSLGIEEGWDLLAEKKVNHVRDKDIIDVKNRTLYTALRFKVEDRDIRLNELKIYFDNGDKLEPNVDETLASNQFSRVIDLGREGRYIDHIEFKYRSVGSVVSGRATVLVLARRYYRDY